MTIRLLTILSVVSILLVSGCATSPPLPPYPESRVEPVTETLHGVEITDPYRWLEDQDSPETRAWIDAQNAYTENLLSRVEGREKIAKRLEELLKVDSIGTPMERGGRYFFMKRLADQDLSVIYMREGLDGEDQVLIDPHTMSEDHTISVGISDISEDGKWLAYDVRQGGEDETRVKIFDVDARRDLAEELPRARYFSFSFKPDRSGFYYTRHTDAGSRIIYHPMGGDFADDDYIFGEGYGPEKILYGYLSEDARYLHIVVYHGSAAQKTEVYFKNVAEGGPVQTVVNEIEAVFDGGESAGDTLYLRSDWNAPNGKIFAIDLKNPTRENWRTVVPESNAVIEGFSLAGGKIFVNYTENVVSRIGVYELDGKPAREITFDAPGSISGVTGRQKSDEVFFSYTSFHVPRVIYKTSAATGEREEFASLDIPFDSDSVVVRQVWYKSKDGTKIPMFLMFRRGLYRDGENPVLLYAYGGFNASLTPAFSAKAALWVERGGVYAMPNLRGGGEFGEAWHRAGMLENKQNVFDDFIAAAEYLIKARWTDADQLAISGGSNGGLLVGAAMTQRPDLFRAVVCSVPLLDMIRYHQFLVARFWVPEYGSSEDPEQFKYIYDYSPYHRVVPGTKYPAVMFITGDSDTRVAPLHARKMTALMQAANGSNRPILLHYDTKAGHSGGKPITKVIEDMADELAFLFWQIPWHRGTSFGVGIGAGFAF